MEGILPLFKPKGMTSHDCVFKLRKILRMKKIGHTGTLDPDVTGVLPICLGRATKVAEYITDAGKSYEGEVTIGFSTTTEDASGEVVERKDVTAPIARNQIMDALQSLTGEITQTPPMFSAVKVNGKRLYEYARQGIEVERPSRKVTIYSIELLDGRKMFEGENITFRFRVACSKGTYIRTLAVMIGSELGYPAHMSELVRIQSASLTLDDCLTFEEIEERVEKGTMDEVLRPMEAALSHLPKFQISDKVAEKVKNGAVLTIPDHLHNTKGPIAVETEAGLVLAIYEHHPRKPGMMKPVKVLRNDQ
ncbi:MULTISPECIES: tRNA pseudouridine(55) synthase TruB [Cytobacillus]|uniref:tRNA pseudouridine synthase B n=3 Tax=Cytobacillus TaxID=2675230 RepID=A0A160M9N9_9BACI|nr:MULTISPECIES: tRNA pseudouridine(55) synthase TruB [Cytobacillus]EFV79361.1 TRNA pseudouridine 55 synthase [Bacillus sp. 2_A_57_CT2]MBY0157359.1 tRNA pseudouridine(55) synthase TruB [Cytobacillus firmus]AND39436.1 tRNA pseudouridine(55) synthase [Cytobacillus oceanisediminis 2691]MBU8729259.1 tRNA pseudouridine(55) synthase TruB [Cytobacillus oceanisediminis]MCM3394271.1 tRNA pseudouridine(55) synthase TruB [Cytobacillus oceanisediminis]